MRLRFHVMAVILVAGTLAPGISATSPPEDRAPEPRHLEDTEARMIFIQGECGKFEISPGNCDTDGGYCCTC